MLIIKVHFYRDVYGCMNIVGIPMMLPLCSWSEKGKTKRGYGPFPLPYKSDLLLFLELTIRQGRSGGGEKGIK